MKTCGTEEARLYSFLIFPADNGVWYGSRPDRFPHGKESPVFTGWVAAWVSHSLGIHPAVVATLLRWNRVKRTSSEIEQRTSNNINNQLDVTMTVY